MCYIELLAQRFNGIGLWKKSIYGASDLNELIAELFAERRSGSQSNELNTMFQILLDDKFGKLFEDNWNGSI